MSRGLRGQDGAADARPAVGSVAIGGGLGQGG